MEKENKKIREENKIETVQIENKMKMEKKYFL